MESFSRAVSLARELLKTIYINSVIYYCEVSGLSEAAGWGHVPGPGRLGGAVDLGPIRD